ncbi:MAG: 3'(2'),5'-bisphosphate nucleotidase CysQ [Acidiferrobacterales bacterium]
MIKLEQKLLKQITAIAREAGNAIIEIYHQDFEVKKKADNSPLTLADQAANEIIISSLRKLTPAIPTLSEESDMVDYEQRQDWHEFWLIDPLDGTREFVKKNGEFTVNIALISSSKPVLGVVYAPVPDIMYSAIKGLGAYKEESGSVSGIKTLKYEGESVTIAASRSHSGDSLAQGIERIKKAEGDVKILCMGSSLKLCLVAEGKADVYPRLGPTYEWDTGAAHAVVNCAGGKVVDLQGNELTYNKASLLNPEFIVQGDINYSWIKYFHGQ